MLFKYLNIYLYLCIDKFKFLLCSTIEGWGVGDYIGSPHNLCQNFIIQVLMITMIQIMGIVKHQVHTRTLVLYG